MGNHEKKAKKTLGACTLHQTMQFVSFSSHQALSLCLSSRTKRDAISFLLSLSFAQQLGGFIDEGMQAISPALFYCRPIQQRRLAVRFVLTPQLASSESPLLWLLRPSRSFSATELLT